MTDPDNFIYNSNYKYNIPIRKGSLYISDTTYNFYSLDMNMPENARYNIGFEYVSNGETIFTSSRFGRKIKSYVMNGILFAGIGRQQSGQLVQGTFRWVIYGD